MKRLSGKYVIQSILIIILALFVSKASGQESEDFGDPPVLDFIDEQLLRYAKEAGKESMSPDSALVILKKAVALAKKYEQKYTTAQIWRTMGERKLQQGDFEGCKRYLDSAFALNEELKDPELTCFLNTLAGTMYSHNSNYAKAASCYFRAVQAAEDDKIEDEHIIAVMYNNLAMFMASLNEDGLSKKYRLEAKRHVLKMETVDTALLINVNVLLGGSEIDTDSVAAMNYYREAYALATKFNDRLYSQVVLENLSLGFIAIHQYDTAEHFLNLAKAMTPPDESWVVIEIATGFLAFGRNDYRSAEEHLLKAVELAKTGQDDMLDVIYEKLSNVYEAQKKYEKAYFYHTKFIEEYEKVKGNSRGIAADFMMNLQSMEHEKAILQKQVTIAAREVAIKKQRIWIATMCLVSVLLGVILIMAYRNYQNKKSLLRQQMHALVQEQEIERLKAEAEGADNERTRIAYDLHDGVMVRLANAKINLNTLQATHPVILGNKHFRDAVEQLDIAGGELRNTAHNLMPEILLEDGLAQAIFYFCKTTEQASGLGIKFLQIGATLPRLQIQVETSIYRIVQGLIQNVIQHAKAQKALVQLQYAQGLCSITVEDNGQGIAGNEGYGLKSIRNRVKILNGTFDIKSSKGAGTTAYLEFDISPFLRKEN